MTIIDAIIEAKLMKGYVQALKPWSTRIGEYSRGLIDPDYLIAIIGLIDEKDLLSDNWEIAELEALPENTNTIHIYHTKA